MAEPSLLGRDSLVDEEPYTAILVLDSRAFTPKPRRDEIVITAAMPIPPVWLVQAGRGRDKLAEVRSIGGPRVAPWRESSGSMRACARGARRNAHR